MEKIEFEKELLRAIKKDDLKSFSFLMPTNTDLNLCYGRFPILSLLYMYSSFKILRKYEDALLRVSNFNFTDEPIEVYKDFKQRARKTLRLFGDGEIVYPILMLGVLDEKIIIEAKYKLLYRNVEICDKLQKIYNLNHKKEIIQTGDNIKILPSRTTKSNYLLCVLSVLICFVICLSSLCMVFISKTNGLGTKNNPIQISTASEFKRALKNGKRYYNLNEDIEISAGEVTKKFAGTIYGNNHIVKIVGDENDAIVKNLTGTINGIKFYLANNEIKITQNSAIISEKMTGSIENCEIIGNFNIQYAGEEDVYFGLFASVNSGKISNCSVSISANLLNEKETNSYFGGIAGKNESGGEILNCVLDGGVCEADTVDIAGIVSENRGKIYSCTNKMQISQTSSKEWHPNVAGIALSNYGTIESSKNYGELSAESTLSERGEDSSGNKYIYYVYVAGIACENYNQILDCRNFGSISCEGNVSNIICGGIVAQNTTSSDDSLKGAVKTSLSKNNITAKSELGQVCVGGIVGVNGSSVYNCGFIGNVDADTNSTEDEQIFSYKVEKPSVVFVGGVVGVNNDALVQKCYCDVDFAQNAVSDDVNKLYGGIVGSAGIINFRYTAGLSYVYSNYYVAKDNINYCAYGINGSFLQNIVTGNITYESGTLYAISSGVYNNVEVESLSNIPSEVILDE